jgi:hypothetical protein
MSVTKSAIVRFLVTAVVAATAFWLPNVVAFGLWPRTSAGAPHWDDYGVPLITVACPLALALLISLVNRKATKAGRQQRFSTIAALAGIWVLAPEFTLLAIAVRSSDDVWLMAGIMMKHLIAAYIMVVVQGGTYALFIATVMLVGMHLYERRETRLIAAPTA